MASLMKYEKYKPSGIDWIGDVPAHWEVKRLKNLASNVSTKSPEISDDDFLVALENIESNTGDFIESSTEYENNGIAFKKSHLLYNKLRPYLNKVYLAERDGICVGDIIVVECSKKLLPEFLQYKMLSDAFCSIVMSSVQGTKMPRTSWEFISSLKFGIPTPDEQLTIANYLDDQTQRIDRLIANKKAQAEKLKELRQIEINNAVTKGLNPKAEMKDSGIEWLGEIPKHWQLKRLKNVSNYIQTGITPPSEKSEYYDGEIPWYGPGGFNGDTILRNPAKYITQQAIEDNEAKLFPVNCIFMIGIGATIGKVGIIKEPSSCNQQLNIINFKNHVTPDFGVYFLKLYENIIINIANFSTLPIYNQVQTGNLKFLLPPKEEQIQIANYLINRTTAIDKLVKNIENQIEQLQELRKIKIYEAVTGKIKVNAYAEATA